MEETSLTPVKDEQLKVLFIGVQPKTAALIANISVFAWLGYIAIRIWGMDPLTYIVDPIRSLFGLDEDTEGPAARA